jgi:DNA-directed RNA polymerase specialized sigma subunit
MWENPSNFNYKEISATQNTFIGIVANGKIFNSYNQQVGVTNEEYKKALDTAKGYQDILYEKGILTKPKTPEEINQELQDTLRKTQEMMAEMSSSLVSLNEKVIKLEHESKEVQELVTQPQAQMQSQSQEKNDVKQAVNTERNQSLCKSAKGSISQ